MRHSIFNYEGEHAKSDYSILTSNFEFIFGKFQLQIPVTISRIRNSNLLLKYSLKNVFKYKNIEIFIPKLSDGCKRARPI